MSGRRLKALVVHDTAFPEDVGAILGTNAVDLCRVIFNGQVQNKIGTWADVLQVLEALVAPNGLSSASIDTPDLLFVDCHFSSDKQAPRLWGEEEVDEAKGKRVDPRGLLYGGILSAYFMGMSSAKPFGFAVYSQDLEAAADNGYALTFFSILDALAGNIKTDRVRAAQFAKRMRSTPRNQLPGPVLGDALLMYRVGLLATLQADYYADIESFEVAAAAIEGWMKHGGTIRDDLALSWQTFSGHKESVLLSSIFADCLVDSEWCQKKVEVVGVSDYLESVLRDANHEAEVLKPLELPLRRFLSGEDPQLRMIWAEGYKGYKQKTLAYVLLWAADRIDKSVDRRAGRQVRLGSVGDINERIGLGNHEINRALGRVLGNSETERDSSKERLYKASTFLENLDRHTVWPYPSPPWLKPLSQKLLRGCYAGRQDGDSVANWPRCLK